MKTSLSPKYNRFKNCSFGAKLISKPEQFILKSDTIENKKKIAAFFDIIKRYVSSPEIDKFSNNDKIKLERIHSKNRFRFNIHYYMSGNKNPLKLPMNISDGLTKSCLISTIVQITQQIFNKQGYYKPDKKLFVSFSEMFENTFNLKFSDCLLKIINKK